MLRVLPEVERQPALDLPLGHGTELGGEHEQRPMLDSRQASEKLDRVLDRDAFSSCLGVGGDPGKRRNDAHRSSSGMVG